MIRIKNITKILGSNPVIDNVSLDIENGEILGLVGIGYKDDSGSPQGVLEDRQGYRFTV